MEENLFAYNVSNFRVTSIFDKVHDDWLDSMDSGLSLNEKTARLNGCYFAVADLIELDTLNSFDDSVNNLILHNRMSVDNAWDFIVLDLLLPCYFNILPRDLLHVFDKTIEKSRIISILTPSVYTPPRFSAKQMKYVRDVLNERESALETDV